MTAGGGAVHHDFLRIDAELGGVCADVAERRARILHAIEHRDLAAGLVETVLDADGDQAELRGMVREGIHGAR